MLRSSLPLRFRMRLGSMYVDYKAQSRDHKRSIRVEDVLVDPQLPNTVMPISWLEQLRSPSVRLPNGFHEEKAVWVSPSYPQAAGSVASASAQPSASPSSGAAAAAPAASGREPNAIRAGPVVLYISGQSTPVVLTPLFVAGEQWQSVLLPAQARRRAASGRRSERAASAEEAGQTEEETWDLRLGLDAIEQCTLFAELQPGGLLYARLPHASLEAALRPTHELLAAQGMTCGLAESPLVRRPWTRMRHMNIDELQRGPKLTEFVGHNPRNGTSWRFSQHTKYFRQGIWKETIRRNEMNEGVHAHSSWQKSPQQAVPEVSFLAPFP